MSAQLRLADCLSRGVGGQKDEAEAATWRQRAEESRKRKLAQREREREENDDEDVGCVELEEKGLCQ